MVVGRADAMPRAAPPADGCLRPGRWHGPGGRRCRAVGDFGLDPVETDLGALEDVLSALSGAFGRARDRDAVLAGFAEQDVATLYLGSSTGLRLSHVAADRRR